MTCLDLISSSGLYSISSDTFLESTLGMTFLDTTLIKEFCVIDEVTQILRQNLSEVLYRVSRLNSGAVPKSEQRVDSSPGAQHRPGFTATKLQSCAGDTSRDVYLEDVCSKEALSTITSP